MVFGFGELCEKRGFAELSDYQAPFGILHRTQPASISIDVDREPDDGNTHKAPDDLLNRKAGAVFKTMLTLYS
jgi:hypothetical protein